MIYPTPLIFAPKISKFYKKNIESLKVENVQPYIFKPDSIANGKKYSFTSRRTHTAQRYFWFFQDSTEFEKKIDKYNLETEKNNKSVSNISSVLKYYKRSFCFPKR